MWTKKWVGYVEHAVHTNRETFILLYYFQVFVQLQPLGDSHLFSFGVFSRGYKKITEQYRFQANNFSPSLVLLSSPFLSSLSPPCSYLKFIFLSSQSLLPHFPSPLLLQLLAGATTQDRLVSSSPRGGQVTTKTPWVVSGSLRPSQETPSRSALTGLYDSNRATHPWRPSTLTHLLKEAVINWDSTQSLVNVYPHTVLHVGITVAYKSNTYTDICMYTHTLPTHTFLCLVCKHKNRKELSDSVR